LKAQEQENPPDKYTYITLMRLLVNYNAMVEKGNNFGSNPSFKPY
jgi:hypothetical protein